MRTYVDYKGSSCACGLRAHYEKQDTSLGLWKWTVEKVRLFGIVDSASE